MNHIHPEKGIPCESEFCAVGITRRKRPRPHPVGDRARIAGKLPAEYAEFRLEDGRTFGEVMGAGFFGPPSGADGGKPISDSERLRIRDGNYPFARIVRENPDRFAPRPEPGPLSFKLDNGEASATPPDVGSFEEEASVSLSGVAKIAPPLLASPGGSGFGATVSGLLDAADDALLPGKLLDDEGRVSFRRTTGYGLTRDEGGLTLTSPSGRGLFDLADEDAAELARIWSPEIADRVSTMGLLWREDLTPAEKRKLLKEAVDAGEPVLGRILTDRREIADHLAKSAARNLARKRLSSFDAVAQAIERGASVEETGELLGEFHAAMLPEVFGSERFVREFLMDLMPGLGNVRSVRHLRNDISEIDRAIETGEWGDAALASGMAILDAIGIIPGGNLLKQGIKLTKRGFVKAVPHLDGLLAERTIRRFISQWGKLKNPAPGAREIFGDVIDEFSETEIKRLNGLVWNRFGVGGGEKLLVNLGKRMDSEAMGQFSVDLPKGFNFKTEKRIFDLRARFRSDIVAEQSALLGRLARWFVGAKKPKFRGRAVPTAFEGKVAKAPLTADENAADIHFRNNPADAEERGFRGVENLRMHTEDVPIDFVIEDLNEHLKIWVKKGKLTEPDSDLLRRAMQRLKANGADSMPIVNYATILVRFGAATARLVKSEVEHDPNATIP